eukprot:11203013-Prorocentrum_lima.AAC.1
MSHAAIRNAAFGPSFEQLVTISQMGGMAHEINDITCGEDLRGVNKNRQLAQADKRVELCRSWCDKR